MTHKTESSPFQIIHGDTTQTVADRDQAIEMAKQISREKRAGVEVCSGDGCVRIRFHNGRVETYVCDSPGVRPQRAQREG